MNRDFVLAALLSPLLLLASCSERKPETNSEGQSPRIQVRVDKVALQTGREVYKLPGTVRSVTIAPLASRAMGTVLEVRVRAGDRVKAGQVLAVMDSREADAMVRKSEAGTEEAQMAVQEIEKNLDAAQANLQMSSATLKRYEQLAAQKSVSPQEFEEVQTRQRSSAASLEALQARKQQVLSKIQQAQSDLSSAQTMRSYVQIRSPLNGVVTQRQVEPGSLAVPGMPLLTVEESGHYRLEIPVEESRLSQIKLGQKIPVWIESVSLENLQGTVSEIEPSADPASRTYLVKINLPPRPQFRSGMYGEAMLEGSDRKAIWLRPEAVVRNGQLEGIYIVEPNNIVRLRLLKLGETTPAGVEVLSGLDGVETYVVGGVQNLQDGSRVELLNQPAQELSEPSKEPAGREVSK